MKYPIYKPYISQIEKDLVNDCLETNWISSKGKYIEMFENKISEFTKSKYAVAVSNGTVALHLALLVHDIGFGDEIIIPEPFYANYNGFASASSVKVVPIASEFNNQFQLPSLENIGSKITPKTKAILICNPSNPTGYVYSKLEINNLCELSIRKNIFSWIKI